METTPYTPELDLDMLTYKVAEACYHKAAGYVYINPEDGLCHNLTPEDDGDFIRRNGFILIWSRHAARVETTDDWCSACEAAERIIDSERLVEVAQKALAASA